MNPATGLFMMQSLSLPQRFALRVVDVGILLALVGVPFLLGGTRPPGHLLLIGSSFLAALGWLSFCSLRAEVVVKWTGAELLLLGGLLLALFQIVPLPNDVIDFISPRTKRILSHWTETGISPEPWPYLSFCPELSRLELNLWLCYGLLFLTTSQRVRGVANVETILRLIAVSTVLMAGLGLAQLLSGSELFLWCYKHPHLSAARAATGSFINRNHFASFLAMGIGPILWWLWLSSSRSSGRDLDSDAKPHWGVLTWVLGASLVLVVFAVLLSRSRGGAIASSVAVSVFFGIQLRRYPSRRMLSVLIGTSVIVGISLSIYGYDVVSNRLTNWELSNRLYLWGVNLEVFTDFPIMGSGLNTHELVYQIHYDLPSDGLVYQHAESSYVQTLSEMGIVGVLLAILGVRLIGLWCIRGLKNSPSPRHNLALLALTVSLAAHAFHAAGDFLWSVPGLMSTVSIMAACAWRLCDLVSIPRVRSGWAVHRAILPRSFCLPRWAWVGVTSCLLIAGFVTIKGQYPRVLAWPHIEKYERLALLQSDTEYSPIEVIDQRILALNSAAEYLPKDSYIASRLASEHLLAFKFEQMLSDNLMSLEDIAEVTRDPALASFDERVIWLKKALGDNYEHLEEISKSSLQALKECPLRGAVAMNLVQLEFLCPNLHVIALKHHALTVRPHDGNVLFAVGQRAFMHGRAKLGFHYWNKAIRTSPQTERLILKTLSGLMPAREIFKRLNLSRAGKLEYWRLLEDEKDSVDYVCASEQLAKTCQKDALEVTGSERAKLLIQAFRAYDAVHNKAEAEHCLNQALKSDPESSELHRVAASWYFLRDDHDVAQRHIEWCLLRDPSDPKLIDMQKQSQYRLIKKNINPPVFRR